MAKIRSTQKSQASTLNHLLNRISLRPPVDAVTQSIPPPPPPDFNTSGSGDTLPNRSQGPMSDPATASMPYHDIRPNRYGSQCVPPQSNGTTDNRRGKPKKVQFAGFGDDSQGPVNDDSYMPQDGRHQSSTNPMMGQMRQSIQNFATGYNGSNGYPSTHHDRAYPMPSNIGPPGYISQQSHQPHMFQGTHNSSMSGISQMAY